MAPHVNRVNQINWREPLLENYYRLEDSPEKKGLLTLILTIWSELLSVKEQQ